MEFIKSHLLGALVVAAGFGAATAALLVGMPPLWSAEAAGWAAALATFAAVVVALMSTQRQLEAARNAAANEVARAEEARRKTAVMLAHAYSRELSYARRYLIATLIDWDPDDFASAPYQTYVDFSKDKPFPDLVFISSTTDRLDGFEESDSFLILTVLTTWQFFNASPGATAEQIAACGEKQRRVMATNRLRVGLDLLQLVEDLINRLEPYYAHHESMVGVVYDRFVYHAQAAFDQLRARYQLPR